MKSLIKTFLELQSILLFSHHLWLNEQKRLFKVIYRKIKREMYNGKSCYTLWREQVNDIARGSTTRRAVSDFKSAIYLSTWVCGIPAVNNWQFLPLKVRIIHNYLKSLCEHFTLRLDMRGYWENEEGDNGKDQKKGYKRREEKKPHYGRMVWYVLLKLQYYGLLSSSENKRPELQLFSKRFTFSRYHNNLFSL